MNASPFFPEGPPRPAPPSIIFLLSLAFSLGASVFTFLLLAPSLAFTFSPSREIVLKPKPRSWEKARGKTIVSQVFLDGVHTRWNELPRRGKWRTTDSSSWLYPKLVCPASPENRITCRAGVAQFVLPVSGEQVRLEISSPGTPPLVFDPLQKKDAGFLRWSHFLEYPPARIDLRVFPLFLLFFLGLLVSFRPWKTLKRRILFLGAFLASVHLAVWLASPIGAFNDSPWYFRTFPLFLSKEPIYFPPGYPAFIRLATLIPFLPPGLSLTLVQHALFTAAAVILFLLFRTFLSETGAFAAALFAALLPSSLYFPQCVLSENLAFLGILGFVWFLSKGFRAGRTPLFVLAGFLGGWAVTARVSPLGSLFLFTLVLLFGAGFTKERVAKSGLALGTLLLVVFVPMFWSLLRKGRFELTASTGLHLYNGVVKQQGILDPGAPCTRKLLELTGMPHPEEHFHWEIAAVLKKKGLDTLRINDLLKGVALESIRSSPGRYLLGSLAQAWKQVNMPVGGDIPIWPQNTEPDDRIETCPPLVPSSRGFQARRTLFDAAEGLWPWLICAFLAGAVLSLFRRERTYPLGFFLIVAGYIGIQAMVEILTPRYSMCAVPFLAGLAFLPLDFLLGGISRVFPGNPLLRTFRR